MEQKTPNQIHLSKGAKHILDTVQKDLFPCIEKLKDVLVRTQKVRVSYQLYSRTLYSLDKEYNDVCSGFFDVVRKLDTPDILFHDLDNDAENMAAYFQFRGGFKSNIDQGLNYIEIIDRTLDRKTQNIQNNRTFLISLIAIVISLLSIIWSPNQKNIQDRDPSERLIQIR